MSQDNLTYKPHGIKERFHMVAAAFVLWFEKKETKEQDYLNETDADIYAGGMTHKFNWLHGLIYPRFFEKIHVELENIEQAREAAKAGTIIYVTKDIGQLEYNFFNYLFLNEQLPLAKFVNELSLWQWLPFRQLKEIAIERARRFRAYGRLPHPISSGYAGAMIETGDTAFIQLKSTAIYNDLYWYMPKEDPLVAVLSACERSLKPIHIIPLHFLWDKRPEGHAGSIISILPNFLRKNIMFWRNYKNRAVVKIGAPVDLSQLIEAYKNKEISERARDLRASLLDQLQQEKKVITGPALKPRNWVIEQTLEDEALQKVIYDVSLEKKSEVEDVKSLARKYINETASDINYSYIEIGCRIMKWVIKNIYDGITINAEGLSSLKKASSRAPVILVPNHRSHMDYLLLSTVLYENSVSIPHVAAGLNLAFWPMGHIFRRCGAFFIRRTFAGNPLYRAVVKAYLKTLLREGYCQEFFVEGGRSRTGKLLRPKKGMLTMISEGIREGAVKEAIYVPVAITYDKVIEEYKQEIEGENKKKERTRDLLHLGKYLKKRYGRIYIRFGEPLSYSDVGGTIDESVTKLANQLMVTINRELVVTPAAIIASSVLISPKRGISHEELLNNAHELIDFLKWKGANFSASLDTSAQAALEETLQQMESSRQLELHREFEPACYEIKESARLSMDYYKNNIIHFMASASCLANILLSYNRKGIAMPPMDELKDNYLFCKSIFANEFAFSTRLDIESHIQRTLSYFQQSGVLGSFARLETFKGITASFFEAYMVALLAVQNIDGLEEKDLFKRMMKYGRHMLLLGKISKYEAISAQIFKNALQNYTKMGLISSETDEKGKKTYSWANKTDLFQNLKLKLEELA